LSTGAPARRPAGESDVGRVLSRRDERARHASTGRLARSGSSTSCRFPPTRTCRWRAFPEHELLRIAECAGGEVDVEIEVDLRPGYGARTAALRDGGPLGLRVASGAELVTLRATVPLALGADGAARARVRLREGESLVVSLAYDSEAPAVLPPLDEAWEALRRTARVWREVAARVRYDGPWREEVVRSVLALVLLSFPPSGAIVAAPTTSLPERPHGDLNWDYRFCWLRDAALTVRALYGVGLVDAADAFTGWLLHTTRLTRPELRVCTTCTAGGLRASASSPTSPARRRGPGPGGTRARAAPARRLRGGGGRGRAGGPARRAPDRDAQAMLRGFGEVVCERWPEPDAGIWSRASRRATGRTRWCSDGGALAAPRAAGARAFAASPRRGSSGSGGDPRARRRARVERRGRELRSVLGGREVDAALLLLGWHGYEAPAAPRMAATWRRIRERLSPAPGLLYRYERSAPDGEGAFGICSAWAIEHLARGGGRVEEAVGWIEHLLARANDLGLFAEEFDPRTGAALGNFPQAFTHVGVVNAVLALDARVRRERGRVAEGEARP
jgi:hypothetical protein